MSIGGELDKDAGCHRVRRRITRYINYYLLSHLFSTELLFFVRRF